MLEWSREEQGVERTSSRQNFLFPTGQLRLQKLCTISCTQAPCSSRDHWNIDKFPSRKQGDIKNPLHNQYKYNSMPASNIVCYEHVYIIPSNIFFGYLCSLPMESLVGTSLHRRTEKDKRWGFSLNSKLTQIIPECSVCTFLFWLLGHLLDILAGVLKNIQPRSYM